MLKTIEDIQSLSESIELECKLAIGRDGKGALPGKTFWETDYLPNQVLVTPDDVFGTTVTHNGDTVTHNGEIVTHGGLGVSSGGIGVSSGGYVVEGLDFPIYHSISSMDEALLTSLRAITKPILDSKRFPKDDFKNIVKKLCESKYLTLTILAELLDRTEDYIRKDILNPMVDNEELLRAFPQTPNDPRQAYTSTKDVDSEMEEES